MDLFSGLVFLLERVFEIGFIITYHSSLNSKSKYFISKTTSWSLNYMFLYYTLKFYFGYL